MKKIFIILGLVLILSSFVIAEDTLVGGNPAIDNDNDVGLTTYFVLIYENAIDTTDTINKFKIHIANSHDNTAEITNVGCYYDSGGTFTRRDYDTINYAVTSAGLHEIDISLNCQVGDYLGYFQTAPNGLSPDATSYDGVVDIKLIAGSDCGASCSPNNLASKSRISAGLFISGSVENLIEFTARNNYTGDSITNFNINLTNSSGTYSLSTTNGTIYSYQDGDIDAVFYSSEYHARSYTSWDSTEDLEALISETNIKLVIEDIIGNPIGSSWLWNITDLTNTTNVLFQTSTGNFTSSPPSTTVTYEVLDNQSAFYPVNHSITFPSLATGEYNLTIEYKPIVLKFIGRGTLTPIDNATITVHYPFSNAQNFTTNESGHIEFDIINGANLDLGNYTFTFQDYIGYISPVNFSRVINNTNLPYEETIEVTEAGINVKVYDRETRELLTKTTQVYVLGVLDRETDTGIVNINSTLINGDYTIQAISDGYSIEQVTFTYTGQSDVDINLYLLNITGENTALLFINARDPYARQVKGASLELTEYNVNELGFTTVSECLSNSNGECSFYIELDTKTYVVQGTATINHVFYLGSTLEAGEIFSVENEVRDLFLIPITTIDKIALDGLIISYTSQEKSFTNATNTSQVNVTFNTNNQLPVKVCLEYFQKSYLSWVSVNTKCLTTSAGQIIGDSLVLDRTSNYKAEIYIENSGNTPIYTYYYNSVNSLEYYLTVKYPLGRYLILFFWIGWLALGLYMKNVPIIAFGHIVLTWILIPLFPNTLYITGAIISTILNYQIIRTAIKKND